MEQMEEQRKQIESTSASPTPAQAGGVGSIGNDPAVEELFGELL